MIDRATVDKIMEATNIVDVVGEFVSLRKAGVNYKGLCPFHDDKTPSFMVSPARQICKCFACGEGGNAVNFLMRHEQITYPEALRWLARKYSIEIQERELTDEEAEKMYRHKSELFAERVRSCPAPVMPGVRELMRQIRADGLSICVVTGSGQRSLLDRLLDDFGGLLERELIVTAFDVTRGKPDPEPYIIGTRRCGVQPWQAVVVENAPLGVRAAVAARCFTIAVNTGPLPDDDLRHEGADLLFPSMEALSDYWHTLAGRVSHRPVE